MAKVPNGVETLPKISIAWTNVTDIYRRTDDSIANMEVSSRSLKNYWSAVRANVTEDVSV